MTALITILITTLMTTLITTDYSLITLSFEIIDFSASIEADY